MIKNVLVSGEVNRIPTLRNIGGGGGEICQGGPVKRITLNDLDK